jgi:hypothetical protein
MRNFNQDEKFFLEIIVEEQIEDKVFVTVGSLFENLANNDKVRIEINKDDKTSYFFSAKLDRLKKDGNTINEKKQWADTQYDEEFNLKRKVATLVFLLDYLEKNHLIYLNELWESIPENFKSTFEAGSKIHIKDRLNKIPLLKGDNFEFIFKKLYFDIIPSAELIEFVKKDYKDEEQIRHEENLGLQNHSIKIAKWLGYVSIAIAVFSTVISSIFSILPEQPKKRFYNSLVGTTKNKTVEQLENSNNTGTVTGRKIQHIKQHINKTSLGSSKTSP